MVTTPVAQVADDLEMTDERELVDFSRTEEMPVLREVPPLPNAGPLGTADVVAVEGTGGGQEDGDSDVFVVRRSSPELPALSPEALAAAAAAAEGVTLFVYGWENVQPGPLSWAFPSLRAALLAVRTMRNAVEWCIVRGREPSIDAARAKGAILIEQNA
jgi:hypothetical protein